MVILVAGAVYLLSSASGCAGATSGQQQRQGIETSRTAAAAAS
jgi:hypothetical protein